MSGAYLPGSGPATPAPAGDQREDLLAAGGFKPLGAFGVRSRTTPYIGMRVLVFNPPYSWLGIHPGAVTVNLTRLMEGEPFAGVITFCVNVDVGPPRVNVVAYDHVGVAFPLLHISMHELSAGDEMAIGYGRYPFCTPIKLP